jgi:hypothetical protein
MNKDVDTRSFHDLPAEPVQSLIDRLPKYFTICCSSKRNSGKTFLIIQLVKTLLKQKKVDMVIVLSNTAGLNKDFDFLPSGLVMKFSEDVLKAIWDRQAKTDKDKRDHVLVILDDVLSDHSAVRSEMIGRLYSAGRHTSTSCICISQVANIVLTPVMKQNSDFLLWSRLNRRQLENIWSSMNGLSKRDFIRWAEIFGGVHYNFCVFDNFTDANAPEEFLLVIRADEKSKA